MSNICLLPNTHVIYNGLSQFLLCRIGITLCGRVINDRTNCKIASRTQDPYLKRYVYKFGTSIVLFKHNDNHLSFFTNST